MALHLSRSLAELLLTQFDADALQHLALLARNREDGLHRRWELDQESLDELADLLLAGGCPALGWWARHASAAAVNRRRRLTALVELGLAEGASAVLRGVPAHGELHDDH